MRILFTGGGTGGHINPVLAVKRQLEKRIKVDEPMDFWFIGGNLVLRDKLEEENIKVKGVVAPKWRRYVSVDNLIDLFKAPINFFQTVFWVWLYMPDLIFCKGGPGALGVVLIGWLYKIPIIVHESDSEPGLTNKMSSFLAKRVITSFEEANKFFSESKTQCLGNPIRKGLIKGSREKAKEIFDLTGERKVLLFMGGSQGSKQINELLVNILHKYIQEYEIIHIAGEEKFRNIQLLTKGLLTEDQKKYYHLYSSLDEEKLGHAYAAADFIVSRAGSGVIFEIAAAQKPSIIIPLSGSAQEHQSKNAYYFSRTGAATVIEGDNIGEDFILGRLNQIMEKEKKLQEMREACGKFAKTDAAKNIIDVIIEEI